MTEFLKERLWKQFAASIDMLGNAIEQSPDGYWNDNRKFFYMAYHTLVFLDYYLTIPPANFSSPLPFTLVKPDDIPKDAIDDVLPDAMYSKSEMLGYVRFTREKCRALIAGLTEEKLKRSWIEGPGPMDLSLAGRDALNYSVLEILLYNMKHVQHHVAQMNMLLRETTNNAPGYVSHAADTLQ